MSSNDIPPQNRGTIQIGQQTLHYERSDKTGQLYVAPGPDLRDWTKIESGALDYSHIAQQEHQAFQDNPALVLQTGNVFPGHDGQKAAQACATCAANEGRVPVMAYAEVAEVPADVQAANDQHAAQTAAEAAQAAADAAVKATLPPSREVRDDLAKQAKMDAQRADLDAQEQRIAEMTATLRALEAAANGAGHAPTVVQSADTGPGAATNPPQVTGAFTSTNSTAVATPTVIPAFATGGLPNSGLTGAADPKDNADIPPTDPDVIAGATPDIQQQAARGDTTTNGEATYTPDGYGSVTLGSGDGEPTVIDGPVTDTLNPYDDPDTRPTMGTDPWTHTPVKIFWAIEGADPDHPYGKKKDGSPRRPVGRKAGS